MPIYAIYSIYTQYNLIICMHNCLNDMNGYLSQYLDPKKNSNLLNLLIISTSLFDKENKKNHNLKMAKYWLTNQSS